jgi:hypothetical protein
MNGERVLVYLWDAGSACGICDDPKTAARHAAMFVTGKEKARVEAAATVLDRGLDRAYVRTGAAHVGRPGPGGIVLWEPDGDTGISGWVPPGPGRAGTPALDELGIDPGAQRWERSGTGAGSLEIAFPVRKGEWARGDWVLMRVAGDPSARVLVFDRLEWLCFLDGVAKGEFDAALPQSSGHAAHRVSVPGPGSTAVLPDQQSITDTETEPIT